MNLWRKFWCLQTLLASTWLMPAGLLVTTACGSDAADSEGGVSKPAEMPAECAIAEQCSGSLVGTWDVVNTTCHTFVLVTSDPQMCRTSTTAPADFDQSGRLSFAADGKVSGTLIHEVKALHEHERSCVEALAGGSDFNTWCAQRNIPKRAITPDDRVNSAYEGSTIEWRCSVSGDSCNCMETLHRPYEFNASAYTAAPDGSDLTFVGLFGLGQFCVEGDHLLTYISDYAARILFKRAE